MDDMTQVITKEELESTLQNDIQTTLLQSKTFKDVMTVEKGDVVVLSAASELSRFNKPEIMLNVGLNLFDKEFEKELLGRNVNEPFSITVDASKVNVLVKSCKRLSVPSLDDTFVKSLGISGVQTATQYNEYLTEKYLNFYQVNYVSWYAMQLFSKVCEMSTWNIDAEEQEQWYLKWKQLQKEQRDFHNVSVLENYDGELEEMERQDSLNLLQICLVYCLFCGEDHRTFTVELCETERLEHIRKTVMLPFECYLKDSVNVILAEEE